jgi:hypothetical protein
MCATASYPVIPKPPCRSPRSQAMPSGQPVLLIKSVNTNSAEAYLGEAQANTVMQITANPPIDQMKATRLTYGSNLFRKALIQKAMSVHATYISHTWYGFNVKSGWNSNIRPEINCDASRPPEVVRAIQPETLIHPVIQEASGTQRLGVMTATQ